MTTHTPAPVPVPPAPLQLGMVIFPGLTLLDLVGPQASLGMHAQTHLLWKTLDPTQLMLEYDPQPPFTAGSPQTAEPEIVNTVLAVLNGMGEGGLNAMTETARRARAERVQ